jgi:FkbM family methyltransferase
MKSAISVPFRRLSGHTIFTWTLGSDPVLVDLGMHRGGFARAFGGIRPRARIYGLEPQPDLARQLSKTYGNNVLAAAVGSPDAGECELQLFEAADSATIRVPERSFEASEVRRSVTVPVLSLNELRAHWQLAEVDVLKVDIEGLETALLTSGPEAFDFARQVSVEFHLWRYPSDRDRVEAIVRAFRAARWRVQDFTRVYDDVLFIRPDVTAPMMRTARTTMGLRRIAERSARRAIRCTLRSTSTA